jgi:hypothetical protein
MFKPRWILVLVALGTAAAILWIARAGEIREAAALLDEAQRELARAPQDVAAALRQASAALELARAEDDGEIQRRALLLRAALYRTRAAFDLALADYQALLALPGEPDPGLLAAATQAALAADEAALAIDLAGRLRKLAPRSSQAPFLAARAHAALARAELARIDELLLEELTQDECAGLLAAARRAAAAPLHSAARSRWLGEATASLREGPRKAALRAALEGAARRTAQAFRGYSDSFDLQPSAAALAGLLGLLLQAGAYEEAALLGESSLAQPDLGEPSALLLCTAEALVLQERGASAQALVRSALKGRKARLQYAGVSAAELARWCELLWRMQEWPELERAAALLQARSKARSPLRSLAAYFLGLARLSMGRLGPAERLLRQAPGKDEEAALEGLEALVLAARASARRAQELPEQEREALEAVLESAPAELRDVDVGARVGQALVRLGELQLEAGEAILAERTWTRVLELLPGQRARHEPRWVEAGRLAMRMRERNEAGLLAHYAEDPNARASPRAGCYEAILSGRWFVEHGRPLHALEAVGPWVREHPRFGPALEVATDADLALGDPGRALAHMLQRAELGGDLVDTAARLARIELARFDTRARLRVARSLPRPALLEQVVERLVAEGRSDLALRALRPLPRAPLTPAQAARYAEIAEQAGRPGAALSALAAIPAGGAELARVGPLYVRAALRAPDAPGHDRLAEFFPRVQAAGGPEPIAWLATVDLLCAANRMAEAQDVVAWLDRVPSPARAQVVWRLALCELLAGNTRAAGDALARLEALSDGGEAWLGGLLLASERRDVDALRGLAGRLATSPFASTPQRRALCLALAGDPQAALALGPEAGAAAALLPESELLRLCCAAEIAAGAPTADLLPESGARDAGSAAQILGRELGLDATPVEPRDLLTLLCALEGGPSASWALARLPRQPPALVASPTGVYLSAMGFEALGDLERAAAAIQRVTRRPTPLPGAWIRREQIARARAGARPTELEALRVQRLLGLGVAGLSTREVARSMALTLEALGKPVLAEKALSGALRSEPDDAELELARAALRSRVGRHADALADARALLARLSPGELAPHLESLVSVLQRATRAGVLTAEQLWTELEALEALRPEDPLLARVLAILTLESQPGTPDAVLDLALARMDRFRARTRAAPVESLRAGEAERWAEFYGRYDPERALQFTQEELANAPDDLDLWRLAAVALAGAGRRTEALRLVSQSLELAPDRRAVRLAAALAAELDGSRAQGQALVRYALQSGAWREGDVQLNWVRALLLDSSGPARGQRAHLLDEVWSARASAPIDRARLGMWAAAAQLAGGTKKDAQRALTIARTTDREVDAPIPSFALRAMADLAEQRLEAGRAKPTPPNEPPAAPVRVEATPAAEGS